MSQINNNKVLIFIDQIIISGSNFLFAILLIRLLGVETFGQFAFCFIYIYFCIGMQNTYLLSPNFIIVDNIENKSEYLSNLFIIGILFILFLTCIEFLYFKFYIKPILIKEKINFLYLFFCSYFYLLQNFIRKVYFSLHYIKSVLVSDILSYTTLFLTFLFFKDKIIIEDTINKIFIIYAISFGVGLIVFANFFKKLILFNNPYFTFNKLSKIGLPLLGSQIVSFFNANFWFVNLGVVLGTFWVGIVRSITNIFQIFNIFYQFYENYYPQYFKKEFDKKGKFCLNNYINKFIIKYTFIIIFILIILYFLRNFILEFFYSDKIINYEIYYVYLLLLPLIQFYQFPYQFGLRVIDKSRYIFYSYLVPSLISLFFSKYFILNFKIYGFIVGLYTVVSITILIQYYFYKKN